MKIMTYGQFGIPTQFEVIIQNNVCLIDVKMHFYSGQFLYLFLNLCFDFYRKFKSFITTPQKKFSPISYVEFLKSWS